MSDLDKYRAPAEIARWRTISLGIGVIALIAWGLGAYFYTEQAMRSWLLGYLFWSGIGIGAMGLLMLQYVAGGAWGVVIRRALEAGSRTMPLVAILFIPIAIGVYNGSFYEWTHLPPTDHVMVQRGIYMAPWFWILRGYIFIGLLYIIALFLNKWSREQDRAADIFGAERALEKASRFSGPGIVAFCLIVTFASVDWVLTLIPHWSSTIWGLLFVVAWALSCLCFIVVLMSYLIELPPMNAILGKRHFHDLGKLMLALVMVWAYFNFAQYIVVWSGNIPEETVFYLPRTTGGWGWIAAGLIFFHFAFPFIVLLQQDFKRHAKWLAGIGAFVLFMRLVDLFWQIGPSVRVDPRGLAQGAFYISWMDIVAPIAVGGIWVWWYLGELMKRPLVPVNDPYLPGAIEHGHGH